MELEAKSENGIRFTTILRNWVRSSPEPAPVLNALERVFLMFGSKVINEDSFIAALHGQKVLDETPLNLRQHLTTDLLRVQHALEVSCMKRCLKELVAALEWSQNETVLTEILKWAEKAAKTEEAKEGMSSLSVMDLAPKRVARSLSSVFSNANPSGIQTREREIDWEDHSHKSYHSDSFGSLWE